MSKNTIQIPVSLANPGQFFACCGLLELMGRLDPDTTAHFARGCFVATSNGALEETMRQFREVDSIEYTDTAGDKSGPFALLAPFHMRLDWWIDTSSGGVRLKTWSGQQSVLRVFDAMRAATTAISAPEDLLDFATIVRDPDAPKGKSVSPLYFDTRRAVSIQDMGFSPDTHDMSFYDCPAVDSLALIGLQRFRPKDDEGLFTYHTWERPLTLSVAALATVGIVGKARAYRFRRITRVRDYKMFTSSSPERNSL